MSGTLSNWLLAVLILSPLTTHAQSNNRHLYDEAKPCLDTLYDVYHANDGLEQYVLYDKNHSTSFTLKSDDEDWNTVYEVSDNSAFIMASQPGSAAAAYRTSPVLAARALRFWTSKALYDLPEAYRKATAAHRQNGRTPAPNKAAYIRAQKTCAKFYNGDVKTLSATFKSETREAGRQTANEKSR